MPILLIIVPLALIVFFNLPWGASMRRVAFWAAMILCVAQGALVLRPRAVFWSAPLVPFSAWFPSGLTIDSLALVMFLAIALVSWVALMVSRVAVPEHEHRFNFINMIFASMAAMNGVVLMTDIFSLYVFVEIAAVASFVLIAFERWRDAYEGAFKYIVLSAVATMLMLSGIALIFIIAGDLSFEGVRVALAEAPSTGFVIFAVAIFLVGLFIKSGLVPFHGWLPDAYQSAPAPVSILLAGVVTKAVGVYTLMRLVSSVFGFTPQVQWLLIVIGLASILVGAFAAIGQRNMKRMLAYSSISQVGYIILGLGTGTPLGVAGAIFHLFNHAIFKSLLFTNAAAVEDRLGTCDMNEMGGLAARMPVTGLTSAVAAMSTAGIPPLSGFWSKFFIIFAAWQAGYKVSACIAILASLVTLAYFLVLQRRVFFGKLKVGLEGIREANAWITVPSVLLMLATVGLGFAVPWLFETFLVPVRSIL